MPVRMERPGARPHVALVTIDRPPFPRPDEPVSQARRDRAGPDAFRLVDLPRAQTLLAQAAGRLIRRNDDRGVVAVLDPPQAASTTRRAAVHLMAYKCRPTAISCQVT